MKSNKQTEKQVDDIKDFKETYVENVIIISPLEVYWRNEDGSRGIRVCGTIRKDGKRCLAPAGKGTDHEGVGFCLLHDKTPSGTKNWLRLTAEMAKGTSLGKMLEQSLDQEVRVGEVNDELRFQQAMILWYIDYVLNRGKFTENDTVEFTKDDIRFLKELNLDMIKSKESAARIKGSMKLDALTVRQFVDQLLPFLLSRLVKLIGRDEAFSLIQDMNEEVFAPMTAQSLISGELTPLRQIPNSLKDLSLISEEE